MSYDNLGEIVAPPNTFTVDHERKPLLYLPDGRALVRRPAGFRTEPTEPQQPVLQDTVKRKLWRVL